MKSIGDVVSTRYNRFFFESNEILRNHTIVSTPIGNDRFIFGRIDHVRSNKLTYVYTVSALAIGTIETIIMVFGIPDIMAGIGSSVYMVNKDITAQLLGFCRNRNEKIFIGHAIDTPVLLDVSIMNRHLFITGVTGSGKSHLAGILIKELSRLQVPCIVIDPLNDYKATGLAIEGDLIRPGVDFTIPLNCFKTDEVSHMITGIKSTLGYDLFRFSFDQLKETNKTFDLRDLIRCMEQNGMTAMRMDGWEFRAAMTRVEHSIKQLYFVGMGVRNYAWHRAFQTGKTIIVDCNGINDFHIQFVVAGLLRQFEQMKSTMTLPPYIIFLDEAHLYIPSERETACTQVIKDYIRMGRHWNAGMILITQNPQEVNKHIITQCNTRFIFALEPDQLDALCGIKGDASPEMIGRIFKYPQGTCLLSGTYETVKHAVSIQVRKK